MITRRTALLSITAAVLSTTACASLAPIDEDEVNDAVSQVEGVTSVDITVEKRGIADWSLTGEIGLPDDPEDARTVYANCLSAIAGVPVDSDATIGLYVYGMSTSGNLGTDDVEDPDTTQRLEKHFRW